MKPETKTSTPDNDTADGMEKKTIPTDSQNSNVQESTSKAPDEEPTTAIGHAPGIFKQIFSPEETIWNLS